MRGFAHRLLLDFNPYVKLGKVVREVDARSRSDWMAAFRPSVGYSLFLLQLIVVSRFLPMSAVPFFLDSGCASYYSWLFTAGFVGSLLACALLHLLRPSEPHGATPVFAASCAGAGAALVALPAVLSGLGAPLAGLCAALLGTGSGVLFSLCQRGLSRLDVQVAARGVMLGTGAASLVAIALAFLGSLPVYACVVLACSVLNAWLMLDGRPPAPAASRGQDRIVPGAERVASEARGLAAATWRYVFCIGAIGFASRVSKALVPDAIGGGEPILYFVIATLASALALAFLWDLRRFSFRYVYTLLSVLVTAVFLPVAFVRPEGFVWVAGCTQFAFSLASMFMVVTTIQISQSRGTDPTAVFGLFAGGTYLIADVGPLLAGLLGEGLGLSQVVVVSMLAIYLVSFASLTLHSAREESAQPGDAPAAPQEEAVGGGEDLTRSFTRIVSVQQDMIPECCDALRRRCGLTQREVEVLELQARGRDLSRMADALYVSENTIRSHCRNLYRKLGVHSKQEALDMLEAERSSILGQAPADGDGL